MKKSRKLHIKIIINVQFNDKTIVSNTFPFGKQDFKYFIGYKDLYAYTFQK